MNKIAVVILNWNGKHFLEKYLPSVTKYSNIDDCEIVIADNASTDDSITFLNQEYPQLRIIKFDINHGFAGGYNYALEQIEATYFLLLNSDVEVTENWLQPLISTMDNDNSIAACMPKIHAIHAPNEFEYAGAAGGFIDKYGFPFCRGRIFDIIEEDTNQYNNTIDIFWATGAALLIRANIYKELGGLDCDFFAHMEEIDLCWRVKNAGYRIVCIPQSTVYHVGGGALPKENPFKTYLNFRNNLYLLYKNLDNKHFNRTLIIRRLLDGIAALRFLTQGNFGNFAAIFKAHMHFLKNLSQLKNKRKYFLKKYSPKTHCEMYQRSIVYDFYIKKKKKYSQL